LKKLLVLIAFSVLLLVPVGIQQVFATHPNLSCPPPGILNTDPNIIAVGFGTNICYAEISAVLSPNPTCSAGYSLTFFVDGPPYLKACVAVPESSVDPTHPDQCQNKASLVNNHCVPDLNQVCGGGTTINNMMCVVSLAVGGLFLGVDKPALFLAAGQLTAAWMIPVIVSGMGFAIVIARKF